MALVAFFTGALLITGLIYGGIYRHRKARGDDRLGPPAIWAAWVALAVYGLGSREDYLLQDALLYPLAAAALWGLATAVRTAKARPRS